VLPARPLICALLAGLLVASCSSGPGPTLTPTPGDMSEVLAGLALGGATVHEQVSGDAGCPGSELHSNAARLSLSLPGDEQRYEVFLFRWRRSADFGAAAGAFNDCIDAYAAQTAGDVFIDALEVAPWRAYGPGWSEDLRTALENSLRAAGGGG
jgi:hypothetical protein